MILTKKEKEQILKDIDQTISRLQLMRDTIVSDKSYVAEMFSNAKSLKMYMLFTHDIKDNITCRILNTLHNMDYYDKSVQSFVKNTTREQFLKYRYVGKISADRLSKVIQSKTGLSW